jgi:RND family efflux transporter MFP subunit
VAPAALASALLLGACAEARGDAAQAEPGPIVRTVAAAPAAGDLDRYTGVVRARVESDLGFRVGGKITERLVDVGESVRAGQPLARIDSTDFQLGAANAAADAAAAVDAASAAERQVAAAAAEVQRTAADEARFRTLRQSGWASAQRYEQVRAASQAAAAQLEAARAQARAAGSSAAAARAGAAQAGNQTRYGVLTADADGVVMQVLAEPGQVVSTGQTVIRLARAGAREAVVSVPETRRSSIARTAEASLYGEDNQRFPAALRELSAAADPLTRTYQARYVLSGAGAAAPLGATVTLSAAGSPSAGVRVPVAALHDPGRGPGVWVVEPGLSTVEFRPVRVAALGQEEVRLASGVRPGERVVALGAHLLKPGQKVRAQDVVR